MEPKGGDDARRSPARVLMLAKGLGRGGTERLIAGTVRHLDPERFEAEVAYLLPWKDAFVPEIEAAGVRVHCLGATGDGRSRIEAGRSGAGWVGRLRRLVRQRGIDLVHTHMPLPAAAARLTLPRPPVLVHTEHNLWERYRLPTRLANRVTYGRNAAAIAVSGSVAAQIRSRVPVEVVTHGPDSPRLAAATEATRAAARRRLGLAADALVVGTVGNFTAKKDQATLLEAAARLAGRHPELRLVLVGSGPLEGELRARTRTLGIEHVAVFTGSRDDVFALLPAFDLFALSSRFEGLPIALLEAMGCGIAPVVTAVGGIPEVVGDGDCGLLVPPGDAGRLAQALGELLADPARRRTLANRAAQRATAFDLRHAVRRIEQIYERALTRTSP